MPSASTVEQDLGFDGRLAAASSAAASDLESRKLMCQFWLLVGHQRDATARLDVEVVAEVRGVDRGALRRLVASFRPDR
jgi:hypothetical protein